MKKILYLMSVLVVLVIVGCNSGTKSSGDSSAPAISASSSPSDIVKQYRTLIGNGKVNDAYAMLSKASQTALERAGGAAALAESAVLSKEVESHGGMKEIQVLSEELKGDTAKVAYSYLCKDGKQLVYKFDKSCIKENGKWKISLI